MRAGLRPPKVKVFKEWFELPSRLVYRQIPLAIRFLVSKDPPSLRVGWMMANEVIYYTGVLSPKRSRDPNGTLNILQVEVR